MSFKYPRSILDNAFAKVKAVIIEPIQDNKVFKNEVFSAGYRFNIPSTGSVNIVIDPLGMTRDNLVVLPIPIKAYGAGPIDIDVYYGGTYGDDGTLIQSANRNLNRPDITAGMVLRFNPTVTTDGTMFPPGQNVIFSNGVPATAKLGDSSSGGNLILVGNKDEKYLIRLTNTDAQDAASCHIGLNWFEFNGAT